MVSLCGRFERDLLFLEHGQIPQEVSGQPVTQLKYIGEEHEKLTDADIMRFSNALLQNDKFQGTLELQGNGLTDLSALNLAKIFTKKGFYNISKLDLSDNNFSSKAGEYIGEALAENPEYTIFKVGFAKTHLEEAGLVRIVEAVNQNKHILKLNIGIITDHGLSMLSTLLKENDSLEELNLQETDDHQKYWTESGRQAFCRMLKNFTQLKKVKIQTNRQYQNPEEKEKHELFIQEIDFYTLMKSSQQKKNAEYKKILTGCEPDAIFAHMLQNIEDKKENCKMPVRKFFNNTFGIMLNDALYELQKRKEKDFDKPELWTHEGMIKLVAFHMLDRLPEEEAVVKDDNSDKDSDGK